MKYKSIAQEAKRCRVAFKGAKVGDLVWFCHHEIPIEVLTEPPENRIKFILFYKSEMEQAIRLHWFRPCKIDLPPELDAARSKLTAAQSNLDAASSNLNTTSTRGAAYSEWKSACIKLNAARSEYADEISALVKLHLPGCPWDGHTLFPEE